MSALKNVTQGFRNLWGAADEDEDDAPHLAPQRDPSSSDPEQPYRERAQRAAPLPRAEGAEESSSDDLGQRRSERYEKFSNRENANRDTSSRENANRDTSNRDTSSYGSEPSYGGGAGARRLRSVSIPLRAAREKNIYTLKPKSLDESAVAADYLKTGCAVVINLEEVEQSIAIRIIDFMSGVCYGLENQGHAMKLGEKIFLFTPGDFELSSDEIDYAENRDLIFKDVLPELAPAPAPPPAPTDAERRSWER